MSELGALTNRLRELAHEAQQLAEAIEHPIAPRLALGDLLRREVGLDITTFSDQLRLDALVEEIARVVLDAFADDAIDLAEALCDLAADDNDRQPVLGVEESSAA